jgi:arsenical pump membrane protein
MHPRAVFALAAFLIVMALAVMRPRGLNEAWPAVSGAGALLALGFLRPADLAAAAADTGSVLLFLLGMMVVSNVLDLAGVFRWAAGYAARASAGSSRRLLLNVFLLGGAVTALLSLDVTVIVLTPIVYATVVALQIDPLPYLYACTFVANTGSLVFPMSNLTNLLVVDRLRLPFWRFTALMAIPNVVAVAVNAAIFLWLFRARLPPRLPARPAAACATAAQQGRFFRVAIAVFALLLAGLFLAGLVERPLWPVALAGAAVLAAAGMWERRDVRAITGGIAWPLFPFVWGMAAVVRGLTHAGWTGGLARVVLGHGGAGGGAAATALAAAAAGAVGANVFNNIPMALLMLPVLAAAPGGHRALLAGAVLAGVNIGPALTTVGSLATMLWLTFVRRQGVDVPALEYLRVSVVTVPLVLIAALAALVLEALVR